MAVKIVIVIGITVVVGGITAWYILNSVVEPIIAPHVELLNPQFNPGGCENDYFLFWVIGHHEMVATSFGLKNTGLTDGRARVAFTADGAKVTDGDFFIGAGKTENQTFQFRVGDCSQHTFWAQLDGVSRA